MVQRTNHSFHGFEERLRRKDGTFFATATYGATAKEIRADRIGAAVAVLLESATATPILADVLNNAKTAGGIQHMPESLLEAVLVVVRALHARLDDVNDLVTAELKERWPEQHKGAHFLTEAVERQTTAWAAVCKELSQHVDGDVVDSILRKHTKHNTVVYLKPIPANK